MRVPSTTEQAVEKFFRTLSPYFRTRATTWWGEYGRGREGREGGKKPKRCAKMRVPSTTEQAVEKFFSTFSPYFKTSATTWWGKEDMGPCGLR
jgi:predicted adenine nucleotide alpha hydrolase (AANH) superfamily ATPase